MVSKNRVAPKETSVPRLELTGAVLLSKLMSHVKLTLKDQVIRKCVAWADSTTVLYWLQSRGTYSLYVRNRVRKINEADLKWLYIPTDQNPADIGSRGCYPDQLGELWFHGPKWISNKEKWPVQTHFSETEESKAEISTNKQKAMIAIDQNTPPNSIDKLLDKPYHKMMRITAYLFRFAYQNNNKGVLTADEIENAEKFWIKQAQKAITPIEKEGLLKRKDGIYEISGRIKNYHPIFIPRLHPFAKSLVQNSHRKTLHGGAQSIICEIRKRFWIAQLRTIAKSVVFNCERCKRYRVKPLDAPQTGLLPTFRAEYTPPFTMVGVDFAGPLHYKLETYEEHKLCPYNGKCYIALFTCATTRAVYIKLCRTAGQEEFRQVLKEFVTRRGAPKMIVSDNAKTFEATSEWLKTLKSNDDLNNYIARENITWRFNLSRAPWWGGFFERLIGIMKRALSKTIGRGYLKFCELENILYDIENFMNNRLLTYQGEDFEQPALTPNTFLRDNVTMTLEEDLEKIAEEDHLSKRLTHIQKCKNDLRYRWMNEYLHALQEKYKIKDGGTNVPPTIGEIVLLKDDVKDKAKWRIARITKELRGSDNFLRGYELKLGNGYTIQRPIQLVCPLEIKSNITEKIVDKGNKDVQPNTKRPKRLAKDDAKAKITILSEEN